MLKKTIGLNDFIREFEECGRGNQFSMEALENLFEFYDNDDFETELDVIAICCDWVEYETLEDYAEDYMNENDFEGCENEEERKEIIQNDIADNTPYHFWVGDDGVLIMSY